MYIYKYIHIYIYIHIYTLYIIYTTYNIYNTYIYRISDVKILSQVEFVLLQICTIKV